MIEAEATKAVVIEVEIEEVEDNHSVVQESPVLPLQPRGQLS